MSDIAIRVENLGKQYRIGALEKNGGRYTYKSLRDAIAGAAGLLDGPRFLFHAGMELLRNENPIVNSSNNRG